MCINNFVTNNFTSFFLFLNKKSISLMLWYRIRPMCLQNNITRARERTSNDIH